MRMSAGVSTRSSVGSMQSGIPVSMSLRFLGLGLRSFQPNVQVVSNPSGHRRMRSDLGNCCVLHLSSTGGRTTHRRGAGRRDYYWPLKRLLLAECSLGRKQRDLRTICLLSGSSRSQNMTRAFFPRSFHCFLFWVHQAVC